MPCTKCEDGKYKWGKTGECKYNSKESCENANPKKYNKMQPTPLGKKTYEEYAKELKEYNLSSAYRVVLGLADDVENLTQQAKEQITEIARDNGFIKETEKSELKDMRLVEKKNVAYEKADEKYFKFRRELESAEDNRNTAEREANEAIKSLENQRERIDFLTKRVDKTKGKATKVRTNLEKKLDALEKAAKDLGVKIPTGEASKVLSKLISLL
jgi:DNA repair exonuclease SbcCD ATPase subunit